MITRKKKTIDECAQLTTKIREEYAKLQQENNQLKIELHKYKTYVEQIPQNTSKNYYLKPIRKRKHYRDLQPESESDESDSVVTEIRRRPRQQKRKRIIYEDELDGVPDYEPQSPSKEEQEENDIQVEPKIKPQKVLKTPKYNKKGITKSIKM